MQGPDKYEKIYTVVQADSPERAEILRAAADQVSPPIGFRLFDPNDPEQAELAAGAFYSRSQERGVDARYPTSSLTLEQCRDNVRSMRQNGRVIIRLTNPHYDKGYFWEKVRALEAESSNSQDK